MPPAIPLIAAAAAAVADAGVTAALAGTALGAALGATGTAIVAGIVGAVVSFVVGYAANALLGSSKSSSSSASTSATADRTQQIRQAAGPHVIILGRVRVSGTMVYIYSPNVARVGFASAVKGNASADYQPNQLLYTVVVLAGHPVSAIREIMLDDKYASDPAYAGLGYVESSLGTTDQTANATFISETDGEWTSAHRLRGRPALYTILCYDPAAYTSVANPSAIVDGAEPYDPRTGLTVWSDNPALLIAWYLTQDFGLRVPYDEIDEPSLIAAANICDEQVDLLDGTSEPRYTCNGTFTLDQAPSSLLDSLKACMDGSVIFSGGIWYIFAGATQAPSHVLTQDHLRGNVTVQANRAAKDSFNAVRGTYVRPDANWQATDAPVRYDEAAVALDGDTYYQDFDFPFTTSGRAVERLMQIALRRNRAERTLTVPLNMIGVLVRPWDIVTFSTDRLPAANYRVTDWVLGEGGVDLTLEEEPDGIYAWNPATDELPLGDVVSSTLPSAYTLDAPTLTVTTPTSPDPVSVGLTGSVVINAFYNEFQFRPDGSGVWQATDVAGFTTTVNPGGGSASFRVRARQNQGISAWVEDDPPALPSSIVADGVSGGGVSIAWETSSPSVQVFSGATTAFSGSALSYTGSAATVTVSATAGSTLYAWVRSVDGAGNYSNPLGPVSATSGTPGTGTSITFSGTGTGGGSGGGSESGGGGGS